MKKHPKNDEILEEIILNIGIFKSVLFTIDGLRLLEVEVAKTIKLLTVEEFNEEFNMSMEEALQRTITETTANLRRVVLLCKGKPTTYEVTTVGDFAVITTIVKAYALDQIENYAKLQHRSIIDIKESP